MSLLAQHGLLLVGAGVSPPAFASAFFASDPMLNTGWQPVSGPSGFYESGANKTYVAWPFVGLAGHKGIHVAAYDHATSAWGERYTAGNFLLANDDHGHPALVRDADGYIHCYFGAHNTAMRYSVTNAADDISTWTQRPDFGTALTYPKPVLVGSTIYLFARDSQTSSRLKLALSTMTPVAGIGTHSALTMLVDFGADSRVYTSECHAVGTDVHFCCTYTAAADATRKNVYYMIYKTATGAITNYDGSVSVASGSLPISKATADASFRVYDHGTNDGDIASLQFDSSGNAHIIFADGVTPTYDLKHMVLSGGTWSSPYTIATLTDVSPTAGYVGTYSLTPGASGAMEAWYNSASGDKMRRVRAAGGTWATAETIKAAGTYDFIESAPIKNASAAFRTLFAEGSGTATDSAAVNLSLYAYGDSGPVNAAIDMTAVDSSWGNVVLLLGGDSRNAAARFIDESPSSLVPTVYGNAQVSTAQSKFGGSSILLDGTGDYLEYPSNTIWDIGSSAYTIEAFIRPADVTSVRMIVARRDLSLGATGWSLYTSATGQLGFIAYSALNVICINLTSAASLLALNTWAHVAVTRDSSGNWRIYHNGVVVAGPTAESAAIAANSRPLQIGRQASNTARDFNGYIDEVRITRGVARYSGAFTVPTAAFPRW